MGNFETPVVSWVSPENLQRFRLFSIIALLPMMVVPIYLNDLTYLYRYLTQWSIEIATISTLLTYFAARKPDNSKLNRIALISLEITIFVSIGTMIAFWSSFPNIYFCCIEAYWIFSLSISHIIPQLIVLANLFLSDIQINGPLIKYMVEHIVSPDGGQIWTEDLDVPENLRSKWIDVERWNEWLSNSRECPLCNWRLELEPEENSADCSHCNQWFNIVEN